MQSSKALFTLPLSQGVGGDGISLNVQVHFRRILMPHTDVSLGDCSYLDTCRHMKTCKFIHYELDESDDLKLLRPEEQGPTLQSVKMVEGQWIQCDIRKFDLSNFGKFSIIMADPPWDIHMNVRLDHCIHRQPASIWDHE